MDDQISADLLREIADIIRDFLRQEGGSANGYKTYVEGEVCQNANEHARIDWSTPEGLLVYTDYGRQRRIAPVVEAIREIAIRGGMKRVGIEAVVSGAGNYVMKVVFVDRHEREIILTDEEE